MDIASLAGLIGANALIILVMNIAGSMLMFWDLTSIIVVLGGALFSTMIRWPMSGFIQGLKAAGIAFKNNNASSKEAIDEIIHLAETARKQSILALEKVPVSNPFLAKGVRFMVDGHEIEAVEAILNLETRNQNKRNRDAKGIFENMGEACPAFGMIGTVIGLIVIMANLSDPNAIGPGLAVALVTTLYGSLIANVFFIPMAQKVKFRGAEQIVTMELITEGVKGIMAGENPRLIKERLNTFLEANPPASSDPK